MTTDSMTVSRPQRRVVAIRRADANLVELYGFGTYVGDFERPDSDIADPSLRSMCRETILSSDVDPPITPESAVEHLRSLGWTEDRIAEHVEAARSRIAAEQALPIDDRIDTLMRRLALNPKIVLDPADDPSAPGGVVWGFQCWWFDEARFDKWLHGRTVVVVPPDSGGE